VSSLTDVSAAVADVITAFGRSITVRVRTVGAYDTTTLSNTVTTADHTVSAVREPSQTAGLDGRGSAADVQRWTYRFLKSALNTGTTTPTAKDHQVDGSATLQITSVETDADGLCWIVTAQTTK